MEHMHVHFAKLFLVVTTSVVIGLLNGCADTPVDPRLAGIDIISVEERDRRDNSGLYRAANDLRVWVDRENARLAQERDNAAMRNNYVYYGGSTTRSECGTYLNENVLGKAAVENNAAERMRGRVPCTYNNSGPSSNASK